MDLNGFKFKKKNNPAIRCKRISKKKMNGMQLRKKLKKRKPEQHIIN